LNDLIITNDLNFLSKEHYEEGRELIEKQTKLISGLRRYQEAKVSENLNLKPQNSTPSKP